MTRHSINEAKAVSKSVPADSASKFSEDIKIVLEDIHLWRIFSCGLLNEMIITKSGRKLFPVVKLNLAGLEPNRMYNVRMDFVQKENCRWKFSEGTWSRAGKAEPCPAQTTYLHHRSPNYGAFWMKDSIQFDKLKVSNKEGKEMVRLNSLHYYEPVVRVYKASTDGTSPEVLVAEKSLSECAFMAVTSYQNQTITNLKKENNPFAKGFARLPSVKEESTTGEYHDNHCSSTNPSLDTDEIQAALDNNMPDSSNVKSIRASQYIQTGRNSRLHPYARPRTCLSDKGYSGSYSHGQDFPTSQACLKSGNNSLYSTGPANYLTGYMNGYQTYYPVATQSTFEYPNMSINSNMYDPYGPLAGSLQHVYYGPEAYNTGHYACGTGNTTYANQQNPFSALDYSLNANTPSTTESYDSRSVSSTSTPEVSPTSVKQSPPAHGTNYPNVFFPV